MLIALMLTAKAALGQVYINEFVADTTGDEWIELYSDGTTAVDLTGWYLEDSNNQGNVLSGTLDMDNRHLLFDNIGFALLNNGDTLTLYDSGNNVIDDVSYPSQEDDNSYARIADGEDNWEITEDITPGTDNANNAPILTIGNKVNVYEGSELSLTLEDFGYDPENDELTLEGSFDYPEGQSYTITDNELVWTPSYDIVEHPNNKNDIPVTIILNDGLLESEKTFIVRVKDTNQEPVINLLFDTLGFVEGVPFSYQIDVVDYDNDDLTFSLVNEPTGMQIDSEGTITWTPTAPGTHEGVIIKIVDSYNAEVSLEFEAMVLPALELLTESIKVNNLNYETSGFDVNQEEDVTVSFNYRNNLDSYFGYVDITAEVSSGSDFVDYSETDWYLSSQGSDSFNFAVPNDLRTDFTVTITLSGELANGNVFTESYDLDFNLLMNDKSVHIDEINLGDDTLSCERTTDLDLELTNTGEYDLLPEVWIFNGPATINPNNGELFSSGSFELHYTSNTEITAGDSDALQIPLDLNELNGNQDLYVYIVSPFFYNENGFYIGDSAQVSVTLNTCMASYSPEENSLLIGDNVAQEFTVSLNQGSTSLITWYVDDVIVLSGQESYTFSSSQSGDYEVKVVLGNDLEEHTWNVQVTDVPLSDDFDTNIEDGSNLGNFVGFIVSNNRGEIQFDESVDLREILELDDLFFITNDMVAVDSQSESGFDKEATITLNKNFENPIILKSTGFNDGTFEVCQDCAVIETTSGFSFTVTGFSTYKVIESQEAELYVADVVIADIDRGQQGTKTITITNIGSNEKLDNLVVELVGVSGDYSATLTPLSVTVLDASESTSIDLQLTVPEDEDAGEHKIGDIKITADRESGGSIEKVVEINLNPRSYLIIEDIEINGKSNGDFSLDDTNDIEIEIRNDYTQDIEDVEVTVRILDVDDDDLEEDAEEQDIDEGDSETFEVEFDLDNEDIDEDSYIIEIIVKGTAEDDTEHETRMTKIVDVDRENNLVIFKRTVLSASTVQCFRQTSLEVEVENIGKDDEDDVYIKVINQKLGIELTKTGIDLEKYSDSDNDYKTTFLVDLTDKEAGSYPLTIEVYYDDGDEKETTELSLEIKECASEGSVTQSYIQYGEDLAQDLQHKLNAWKQGGDSSKITGSLRENDSYTLLLGVLVVLVFVAVLLSLMVLLKKKK